MNGLMVVLLAIALIEIAWARRRGVHTFRDTLSSVANGMGQQVITIFLAGAFLAAYTAVVEHVAPVRADPGMWWHWVLLLIGIVVLIIVANTIRLTIVARRETHRVLFLLGADTGFVRLPLVLEGVIACLLAAGLAIGIAYAAFLILSPHLAILPTFLPAAWIAAFAAAAALLGAFAGWLATTGLDAKEYG